MNTYEVGDKVRLTGTFLSGGVGADPTGITVTVLYPRNAIVQTKTVYTYPATVTRQAAGIYFVDVTIDREGIWDYRIAGTGAIASAEEGAFNVPDSPFF